MFRRRNIKGLQPIVALEVGTSKVVALVGEMREDGHIVISGIGQTPARGVRKSEVVDFQNAQACVRSALGEAEERSQVAIHKVHLAISGAHIQCASNRGSVPVGNPQEGITPRDVSQVMNVARAIRLPEDRELLHTVCQYFTIDDHEPVVRPEGFVGSKLTLEMLILHGVRNRLQNTVRVVTSLDMEVQDTAFAGLCAALAVLTPEQKEHGALVIDLGGGTTSYVAYAGNVLTTAGTLGVGGDHITNDIALAFKIPLAQAETLKKEHGAALVDAAAPDRRIEIAAEDGFRRVSVSLRALQTVIHLRTAELLTIVRDKLAAERALPHLAGGVILTGGGAHLRQIAALAEKIFDQPCVPGRSRGITGQALATDAPEYMAPLGMVRYGFMTALQRRSRSLGAWFKEAFGIGSGGE
jgi:cell division protein FtsA